MSHKGGKSSTITSFKDSSIGTGTFLLDVLMGMKSSYVDYDLVIPGRTDDDAYMNAKLSISIARKMGATIWLVPEDICQLRGKLVVTFIGGSTSLVSCFDNGTVLMLVKVLLWRRMRRCNRWFMSRRELVVYSAAGSSVKEAPKYAVGFEQMASFYRGSLCYVGVTIQSFGRIAVCHNSPTAQLSHQAL